MKSRSKRTTRLYQWEENKGIYRHWKSYYLALLRAYKLIRKQQAQALADATIGRAIEDPQIVYLDRAFNLTDKAGAALAKIRYSDGRIIFAIPIAQARSLGLPATFPPMIYRARAYSTIRREHWESIYGAIVGYLDTNLPITQYRKLARGAIRDHFPEAFYLGYGEASGEDSVAASDEKWLRGQIDQAIGFLDELFQGLKAIRKTAVYDADEVARRHADGYANALDAIHGQGRLRGNQNLMLTFDGDDGAESCDQCQRYKGQRHRARWWIKRDLVRRNGNENFDCGRWDNCHHHLYTDDGELWSP